MKSKIQGRCLLERVGILKEVVFEETFLQQRPRLFSKNGYIFKRKVAFKEKHQHEQTGSQKKQGLFFEEKGNYMNRTSKMGGGSLSRKNVPKKESKLPGNVY